MNNILRHKLMELSEQSGYKKDFFNGVMKQKDLLPKNFEFRKDSLSFLLKKFDKKLADFIKDTYAPKEQKNKAVQIHKLLNPKTNAPKYYTDNDLANDLAHYFNQFRTSEAVISPNFFMGDIVKIEIIGSLFGNGQIGLSKKKDIIKVNVHPKYADCQGVLSKVPGTNGMIRLFRKRTAVHVGSDNRFGLAQDKKTKTVWFGYIEPQSNGTYDILDKSYSTGKTISKLAENIQLSWSSRIKSAYYPGIYEN